MINRRALYLLFGANTVSGASQGISMIAIPWYFIHMLDKGSALGLTYMLINIVSFFWGLYAGTLIDRHNRKHIFIFSSVVGGLVVGCASIWGFTTGVVPMAVAALVFATTVFIYNIHYPNLYAFAQEITEPNNYGSITSWLEIQGQLTNAFAGGVAAMLITGVDLDGFQLLGRQFNFSLHIKAWGLHHIFLLDACTYALAIALLSMMKFERVAHREIERGSIWKRLSSGMKWLRKHPVVLLFGTASYALFVTVLVTGFFLIAVYVDKHLQQPGNVYAFADMLFALGSVLAGIFVYRQLKHFSTVAGVTGLTMMAAFIFLISAFNYNLLLFFVTYLLLGLCNAGTRIMRVTWMFNHVPNTVIGRTGSVFNSLNVMFRVAFIGLFSLPFFMSGANVKYAFILMAAFLFTATAALLLMYGRIKRESVSG